MHKLSSLWMDSELTTDFPTLSASLRIDVAIIGGGLTGISLAYFLRDQGLSVAVIEADKIAAKTSGHTTAKVTVCHGLTYAFLEKNFSPKDAKIYAQSHQWAIEKMERVIFSHNIDCQWSKRPVYAFSQTAQGLKKIKDEYRAAMSIGLPVSYFHKDQSLPFDISGEIMFEDQAIFHPRKFIISLAHISSQNNVLIYERTRVTEITKKGATYHLKAGKHAVIASCVVLATNYPIYDKGLFFLRMKQMRSYALAVTLNGVLPEGAYIGIDGDGITYRPYTQGGDAWAIIGGEDHPTGDRVTGDNPFDILERKTRKLFDVKSVDYRWAAQDSTSIDRVPYIGKMPREEHMYVATGFGEWGMTTGFVAAKILSDLIVYGGNEWEKLYRPTHLKSIVAIKGAKEMAVHTITGFGSYLTRNRKNRIREIKRGDGEIISHEGKKCGSYKDLKGRTHIVSAVCTHMGCVVKWNAHERSWDCPCHGSRFDIDGEILNTPAVKKLQKKHDTESSDR